MRQKIILFLSLFCCQTVYSQKDVINNDIDSIYVYKGTWFHVDEIPYYPDDYMLLTVKHQENVWYQKGTVGRNRIMIMIAVDYFVDTSGIINFDTGTLCLYGIMYIEDSSGNKYYYWAPPDSEWYDESSFDYSCLSDLYAYINMLVGDAKLSSSIHGFEPGDEGNYVFGLYITPNCIDCFKRLSEPQQLYQQSNGMDSQ